MNSPRHSLSALLLCGLLLLIPNAPVHAGSATWNLNPTSGNWNIAANWTPTTVPNGPADTATFDVSNTRDVSLAVNTEVNSLVFNPGASSFAIALTGQGTSSSTLTISGAGIVNNSGVIQQLVTTQGAAGGVGFISFIGNATAGGSMVIINSGRSNDLATLTSFFDDSSAGSATFINKGGLNDEREQPGLTSFDGNATAADGTFFCISGGKKAFGGAIFFSGSSTAGNGTFVLEGATVDNGGTCVVNFNETASAANGIFTVNGSDVLGSGANISLVDDSTAGNATLIANAGIANGGAINFEDNSTGGTARIEVFGNGILNIAVEDVTIGSLEGDGLVALGDNTLTIGSNSLSTTFSGVIQHSGSLVKIGTGTLKLSGLNTYTGGTTVEDGTLLVATRNGSGAGSGPVQVNAGTFGGGGIVAGAVTVGTGMPAGASLAPGERARKQTTLTIQSALSFKAGGTYVYRLHTKKTKSDRVIANGVTIEGGTVFSFVGIGNRTLTPGTVFTAISNTAATPISGTFANLPDGSTFTVGRNNYQANYEGGDGNDLTLTVVP